MKENTLVLEITEVEDGVSSTLNNNNVHAKGFILGVADAIVQLTGGHATEGVEIALQIARDVETLVARRAEEKQDVEVHDEQVK